MTRGSPGPSRARRRSTLLAVLGVLLTACSAPVGPAAPSSPRPGGPSEPPATAGSAGSTPATPPGPPASPTPTPTPTPSLPEVESEWGLAALMAEELDPAGEVTRERLQTETEDYERWEVSYPSGDLTITGIMLVPAGDGPFPAVVLNHGYIDRDTYWSGQGVPREQEYLAQQGFVVLHTDYRGHAGSEDTSELDHTTRTGYARDALAAAVAVGNEDSVDPDRVAMMGRSMGGGVTLAAAVAHPELVDAAVVYASVSTDYLDNLRRWDVDSRPDSVEDLYDQLGTPADEPEVYDDLGSRGYLDRLAEADVAVQLHHGTEDESCPVEWARETEDALDGAGVRTDVHYYEGEGHTFEDAWQTSIERTVGFLEDELGD